jgi:hypothetical protein
MKNLVGVNPFLLQLLEFPQKTVSCDSIHVESNLLTNV